MAKWTKFQLQCRSLQQHDMSPQMELLKFYNCTTMVFGLNGPHPVQEYTACIQELLI